MRSYYLMVNTWGRDKYEGRGDLRGDQMRLMQMTIHSPELAPVVSRISNHRHLYTRLLSISLPEALRFRTAKDIENEVLSIVGEDRYEDTLDRLDMLADEYEMTPRRDTYEAVLAAYLAYEEYLQAALLSLKGTVESFKWIGQNAGQQAVQIDPRYLPAFVEMRLEIRQGYGATSVEQKNLIQGLFILAFAVAHGKLELSRAEEFIRKAVEAIRWAYIVANLDGAWAALDAKASQEYAEAFTGIYGPAVTFLESSKPLRSFGQEIYAPVKWDLQVHYPFALYLVDPDSWMSQNMAEVQMRPYRDFPSESEQDRIASTLILGTQGSGKTTIAMSLLAKAVWGGALGLVLKSDSRNQGCYMQLPIFGNREAESFLSEKMRVKPHGLPTMILDVIRPGEHEILKPFALTRDDRIVEVDDPNNFQLDFALVVREAKRIRDLWPNPKPDGSVVVVRNLNRQAEGGKTNEDLAVTANMIVSHSRWRQNNYSMPVFQLLDEIRGMAARSMTGGEAGSDVSRTTGQLMQMLVDARGFNLSLGATTVAPMDVVQAWVSLATNILFKDLPADQAEHVLLKRDTRVDLRDESQRLMVYELNSQNAFEDTRYWFHYDRRERNFNVVRACPAPTYLALTNVDPHDAYKRAEEITGQKLLIESWPPDWEQMTIATAEETQPTGRGRAEETFPRLGGFVG